MAGDPTNARLWADADVYIAFLADNPTPTTPATIDDPFGPDWDLVGLLNGDDGFTESREEETTDHFAWGGLLIRTGRRNFKLTRNFTALESNETTYRLRYPGSSETEIYAPSGNRIERVKIAFETVDGDLKRRVISAHEAEVIPDGDVTENEADISAITFMATIYPTAAGLLFNRQQGTVASS